MINTLKSVNKTAHSILADIIKPGDTVVDATCGNGYDTLFLAEAVGEKGKVYAFDVQPAAIEKTSRYLEENNVSDRVVLIEDDHARMGLYLEKNAKAFIFNLGFLPGGNHNALTKAESTVKAVNAAIKHLASGGIILVTVYQHKEGKREAKYLYQLFTKLSGDYNAYMLRRINRSDPPFIFIITRD